MLWRSWNAGKIKVDPQKYPDRYAECDKLMKLMLSLGIKKEDLSLNARKKVCSVTYEISVNMYSPHDPTYWKNFFKGHGYQVFYISRGFHSESLASCKKQGRYYYEEFRVFKIK